ncbi:InlB B-repeat-containing protein [Paenibacillus yanchengensis]|uniref:InlB B-repeat-containing protein n=1 Tax=Paenibacillus yanchengensis TaxID=2035833 RepID=A0ABW4YK28_9BACL
MKIKKFLKKAMASTVALSLVTSMYAGIPAPVAFAAENVEKITLHPSTMKKEWDGWGTALVWFGNATGGWKDKDKKNELVEHLYGQTGLEYNIARYNIGGGDDPDRNGMRPGADMPGFSTGFDDKGNIIYNWAENPEDDPDVNQRWWLLEAKKKLEERGEKFVTEAFSNSPPYYMTKSGTSAGNSNGWDDNLDYKYFDIFSDYLAEVVKRYKEEHKITFDTLSPINEPHTGYWHADNVQEGSQWTKGETQSRIFKAVDKALRKVELRDKVKISGMEESQLNQFVDSWYNLDDEAKGVIDQLNAHTYGGSQRTEVRKIAKDYNKDLWMSEVDLGPQKIGEDRIEHDHNDIRPALALAERIMDDIIGLEPQAWVLWQAIEHEANMRDVENQNWGLIHSGLEENEVEDYWLTKKYYGMGQFSKFIPQGSQFLDNNDWRKQTLTAFNESLGETVIVYRNPDNGSKSLQFDLSEFTSPGQSVEVYTTSPAKEWAKSEGRVIGNQLFTEVDGRSITTFVIKGSAYDNEQKLDLNLLLEGFKGQIDGELASELEAALVSEEVALKQATLEKIGKSIYSLEVGKIVKSNIKVHNVSSEEKGEENAENAIDDNLNTIWHTEWNEQKSREGFPHSITLDLGKEISGISQFEYLPRQDNDWNGIITKYSLQSSLDGVDFSDIVTEETWLNNKEGKTATFEPVTAQYIKFIAHESQDRNFVSAAELNLFRTGTDLKAEKEKLLAKISEAENFIAEVEGKGINVSKLKELVEIANSKTPTTLEGLTVLFNQLIEEADKVGVITGIKVKYAPTAHQSTPISNMTDGDSQTMYESNWDAKDTSKYTFRRGEYIVLDLGEERENIGQIMYTPRQTGKNVEKTFGRIERYKIYTSDKEITDKEISDSGGSQQLLDDKFKYVGYGRIDSNKNTTQTMTFEPQTARFIALQVLDAGGGGSTLSIAEIGVRQSERIAGDFGTDVLKPLVTKLEDLRGRHGVFINHLIGELVDEINGDHHKEHEATLAAEAVGYYEKKLNQKIKNYTAPNYSVSEFRNGKTWNDINGEPIQAHGGGIIYVEGEGDKKGKYYWYGEDKTESNLGPGFVPVTGVHAYSSEDLYNWKDEGIVLPVFNNPNLGDDYYKDSTNVAEIPMYIHEDDDEYKEAGKPFTFEQQNKNRWELNNGTNPSTPDKKRFHNYAGNMKSPIDTLKKHNSKERIAQLNKLYEKHSLEEKQKLYGLFNWDKVVERPKVVYNEHTKKYVMWWHHDGPIAGEYWTASGGVAVSNSPTGPFEVVRIDRLANDGWNAGKKSEDSGQGMLRDMTLYVDDDKDKTAYLIYSSEENNATISLKLDKTYTKAYTDEKNPKGMWGVAHKNNREAPTMFKYNKRFYSITSGLSGWDPNQAEYHSTDNLLNWNWKFEGNPFWDDSEGTTHRSQSTHVLPVRDNNGEIVEGKFIFMADRWVPYDLKTSKYIWFPLEMFPPGAGGWPIAMGWKEKWNLKDEFKLTDVEKEEFTVTFESNGGSKIAEQRVKDGQLVTEPDDKPSREGFDFKGWFTKAEGGEQWNFNVNTVENNLTLYARWEVIDENEMYTVTFENDGKVVHTETKVKGGSTITAPEEPSKEGYTFLGWGEVPGILWNFAIGKVTSHMTLVAQWKKNDEEQTFTITFNSNGGSAVTAIENIKPNTVVSKPADPTRANYTFKGWYEDEVFKTEWNFTKAVTSDMTLYAQWEQKPSTGGGGVYPQYPGNGNGGTGEPNVEDPATYKPQSSELTTDANNYATVVLDSKKFAETAAAFAKSGEAGNVLQVVLPDKHTGYDVQLPLDALSKVAEEKPNAVLAITSANGQYNIPVSLLKGDGTLHVTIAATASATVTELDKKLQAKTKQRVSDVVTFAATIETDGSAKAVTAFDVTRTLELNKAVENFNSLTVIAFDPVTGNIQFVPATFKVENGKTIATFKQQANGIYTVVEGKQTFTDMTNHWAQQAVETLASKLIVNGKSATKFYPNGNVTRAEFASMLVRGLGLVPAANSTAAFTDVAADKWYAQEVNTAVQYGLVNGVGNNKFAPTDSITREQMAVMIMNAVATVEETSLNEASNGVLASYKDGEKVSKFAKAAVQAAIEAKLMTGKSGALLAPQETANRAEAATMLQRLLIKLQFMN